MWWCVMIIPVSNITSDNETISNEISKKDERSNNDNNIIIPLRLLISETTQRIFPYPPKFDHQINFLNSSKI